MRVVVADDQEPVRTGLRMLLETLPGVSVVGEVTDGDDAVALARTLRPDAVLMDIRMPRMDGIAATAALAGPSVQDPIPVVIVTTFGLDEYVHAALRAGAKGFLLKGAGRELVREALRAATQGGALISPQLTMRLLSAHQASAPPGREPSAPLTTREEEVLALLAAGKTNNEICAELHVSLGTAKTHIAGILTKLGVRNRVEAAMWAYESGRMRPDP